MSYIENKEKGGKNYLCFGCCTGHKNLQNKKGNSEDKTKKIPVI